MGCGLYPGHEMFIYAIMIGENEVVLVFLWTYKYKSCEKFCDKDGIFWAREHHGWGISRTRSPTPWQVNTQHYSNVIYSDKNTPLFYIIYLVFVRLGQVSFCKIRCLAFGNFIEAIKRKNAVIVVIELNVVD